MKIIFMGTPAFSLPSLESLHESGEEVLAVVTQPARRRGRGLKKSPPPVKSLAVERGIPVLEPEDIKDREFILRLRSFNADAIVVVAYGRILTSEILSMSRVGCINLHPSLLPRLRGAAPINWAVILGEDSTGVTTMVMDEGMDTGDILLQKSGAIGRRENAGRLHDRLSKMGARLLIDTIRELEKGTIKPRRQNHVLATYAPPIKKEDRRINWNRTSIEIDRLIRGLSPRPGAYTTLNGKVFKIYEAESLEKEPRGLSGTIIDIQGDKITVSTGAGSLNLTEIQKEGHRRMKVQEFLRGHRIQKGSRFE